MRDWEKNRWFAIKWSRRPLPQGGGSFLQKCRWAIRGALPNRRLGARCRCDGLPRLHRVDMKNRGGVVVTYQMPQEFVALADFHLAQMFPAGKRHAAAVWIDLVDRRITQAPFTSPLLSFACDPAVILRVAKGRVSVRVDQSFACRSHRDRRQGGRPLYFHSLRQGRGFIFIRH
jgi:hypothetical protein